MGWMDFGDVRKARGGKMPNKGLKADDAKRIAQTDPAYKSVDKNKRKAEKKRGENVKGRRR